MPNALRADALRLIVYPGIFFAAALLLLYATNADLLLADAIYALGDQRWAWRDAWLTNTLIHDGGRTLVGVIAVALLGALLLSMHLPATGPVAFQPFLPVRLGVSGGHAGERAEGSDPGGLPLGPGALRGDEYSCAAVRRADCDARARALLSRRPRQRRLLLAGGCSLWRAEWRRAGNCPPCWRR
jgi:hypothetical protein